MENDFNWILKIIQSCTNDFHFGCVDALIDLFNEKYKDENKYLGLIEAKVEKYNILHAIIH